MFSTKKVTAEEVPKAVVGSIQALSFTTNTQIESMQTNQHVTSRIPQTGHKRPSDFPLCYSEGKDS